MRKTLTAKFVESLKPGDRRVEIRDTLLPGFGMRISPTGKKAWFAVGRVGSHQVRHTIGSYPAISLAEGRENARTVLRDMQLGVYAAIDDKPEDKNTLEQVISDFIEIYAKPRNRSWKAVKATLRKFQSLNHRMLSDLKRADIVKVLDGIVANGSPVAANRAMSAIKKVFAWALDRGIIPIHPLVGLKKPGRERSRDRLLDDSEIQVFWQATQNLGFPFGPALQMLLLTGQRRGEVAAMRWSQLDFPRQTWTIPVDLAKNGRPHEVPLSTHALDILNHIPKFTNSDFVFTTTGTTPISGFGRVKTRLDIAMRTCDWRIHDLRRTAASGMARIGIAPHVIEKILNHVSGQISGVAAVYNRHGYQNEKRQALEDWSLEVKSISAQSQVPQNYAPASVDGVNMVSSRT